MGTPGKTGIFRSIYPTISLNLSQPKCSFMTVLSIGTLTPGLPLVKFHFQITGDPSCAAVLAYTSMRHSMCTAFYGAMISE